MKRILHGILLVAGLSLVCLVIYYSFWFIIDDQFRSELGKGWPLRPLEMLIDYVMCCCFSLVGTIYYWHSFERTERERDRYKLQALENQINPHFVFNNFSILADLIEVNPKRASNYLMNLSKVYRYTLLHLDKDAVSLQEELDYLKRYLQLLSERFGDTIKVNISGEMAEVKGNVPPSVLQMLVENAVKHNEHTKVKPLTIDITSDGNQITVSNNKQSVPASDSSNVGLHNIRERYRLLSRQQISLSDGTDSYVVTIPIIKKQPS